MVHSNDMKDMGGLRKYMPVTHFTFLIACLAIAGVPPFAGFFSKEAILHTAYESNKLIYTIGLITSGITAFYMFRLYFNIFWNKEAHLHGEHHGEGTFSMRIALIILATCTLIVGFIPFSHYVTANGIPVETELDITFSILPVVLVLAGIGIAFLLYSKASDRPDKIANSIGGFYKASYHKFYIDEVYLFVTKKIIFNLIGKPAAWFDRNIVDGFMNLVATITEEISAFIKGIQSGKVQGYAMYFFLGIVGLTVLFVYFLK